MTQTKERVTLDYEAITLHDPGGEQIKIPVSRKRIVKFLDLCTDGIVTAHPKN